MAKELDIDSALSRAIVMSSLAHENQRDLAGRPYILHPIAVMNSVSNMAHKVLAVLHDIREDTPITSQDLLNNGIPQEIVDWVDSLTMRKEENYIEDYIPRICRSGVAAMTVKLADLHDNMRPDRPAPGFEARMMRYLKAKNIITTSLSNRSS